MKCFLCILFLLFAGFSFAQRGANNYSKVDWYVQSIEPAPPAELAKTITLPFTTDREKVRAIFTWIAEHISYRVRNNYSSRRRNSMAYIPEQTPDTGALKSADEFVAETVLQNRSAICDGYTRLFKTLCDYAGIRSVIVTGYARSNLDRVGQKFRSNHNWNAVYLDSAWHLLDVTWASGSMSYFGDAFIKNFDDYYFLTPPEMFARDHFPDELQWSLLPNTPVLREFDKTPYRQRSFIKYSIINFQPTNGLLEVSPGDTLQFSLECRNIEQDKKIAPDTLSVESGNGSQSARIANLYPVLTGNRVSYQYIVENAEMEWLHLVYNKDVILRYKLKMKKEKVKTSNAVGIALN